MEMWLVVAVKVVELSRRLNSPSLVESVCRDAPLRHGVFFFFSFFLFFFWLFLALSKTSERAGNGNGNEQGQSSGGRKLS